jgi:hypothetical protein
MTSDETLVAQVVKALLTATNYPNGSAQATAVTAIGAGVTGIAIKGDAGSLTLPVLVIEAKFSEEEVGASVAKRYDVSVELRGINKITDPATIETVFGSIAEILCPATSGAFGAVPTVMSDNFSYFRIEKQIGSANEQAGSGDLISRTRIYSVFAKAA